MFCNCKYHSKDVLLILYSVLINTNIFHIRHVRLAERSKAPDSREDSLSVIGVFWSTYVGVGSNPTSDNYFQHVLYLFK